MTVRRLLVMRHAKSDWSEPGQSDFDRPLAARGRRAAAAMGVYLKDEALAPDLVLCSAARRASETWATVAQVAGLDPEMLEEERLYHASAAALLDRIQAVDDGVRTLLLVGHAPGYDGLARGLSGNRKSPDYARMSEKFPTGALAVLVLDDRSWRETTDGSARLDRFVTPKDLL